MKKVHSFKKLIPGQGSPVLGQLTNEDARKSHSPKRHSRSRSASAVSAMAAFALFENIHGIAEVGENADATSSASLTDTIQSDGCAVDVLTPSGGSSTASTNEMPGDVPDGSIPGNDTQREHLRQKILKISEQIKIEQGIRDDNVAEYLRLSVTADKQQAMRMKSVFEKKNLKSKAVVAQLQKKLESYHRKLRELDSNGKTLGGKLGFKDVQAKLNDFSGGVASSVQGITNKLKTVNKKFPSVDNIASLKDDFRGDEEIERSNSVENVSATTSDSGDMSIAEYPHSTHSLPPRPLSPQPGLSQLKEQVATLQTRLDKLTILEPQHERIKTELDNFRGSVTKSLDAFAESLEQANYRCSCVSGQMQDLTDLHRREMDDVKQDMASLEEKLEYHAQERARDMQEALESCQTRITKMEVQQQQQHQQLVTMEGVENATAKALVGKLINLLLSVLALLLVFVSTVSSIVMPFVRNQTRIVVTGICFLLVAVLYRNWTGFTDSLWWWR